MTTFETLCRAAQDIPPGSLADEVSYMLDAARVNADDTVYVDKSAPESDWHRIAMDSLESACAYSRNSDAVSWFLAHGVTF